MQTLTRFCTRTRLRPRSSLSLVSTVKSSTSSSLRSSTSSSLLPRGLRPRSHLFRPLRLPPLAQTDRLVLTLSTAAAYDRASLLSLLQKHVVTAGLMDRLVLPDDIAASCVALGNAHSDLFFFLDMGAVVFWNVEDELKNVVIEQCVKFAQIDPIDENTVEQEAESVIYVNDPVENEGKENNGKSGGTKTRLKNNKILLGSGGSTLLEKFAFSHALAASVSLGALEAGLDRVIESLQPISDDLKRGSKIQLTRQDVLRRLGEIFALRHAVNLSSDLLNTPDFYWDREQLEQLYMSMRAHLSVSKRTKTTNEKLTYCSDLLELVKDHLNDKHHVRLEWFIIILILIEVIFELIHFIPRH